MRYSDLLIQWMTELGYTHCFFVPGGNIMHLINSADQKMTCVGFVHEVAAAIAAEYFNEVSESGKAFALVTAGPGLTNAITGMAGAHLESRELVVIGGQVKSADLSHGTLRQNGLQEIDGVAIARPVSKLSVRLDRFVSEEVFKGWVRDAGADRPGVVFIEACLDVQGAPVDADAEIARPVTIASEPRLPRPTEDELWVLRDLLAGSERPVLLLGGGTDRATVERLLPQLARLGVPLMTTWNGADRVPADHPLYFGRPNTWGQRFANILINQADLLIALGTRLNFQQTGFNWEQFVANGKIVQVDIDSRELTKGHPRPDLALPVDANVVLEQIANSAPKDWSAWVEFCREVRSLLPLNDPENKTGSGFVSPFEFVSGLSVWTSPGDLIVPCSSGGAFTVMMQAYLQRPGQKMVTNKSLASMGYGLSGAIGAALAYPGRRTVLTEGDGGFMQNLQELGTVAVNQLNLKIFIFDDSGYASIRTTQKNYFNGKYFGCDRWTGLGLPDWEKLFDTYGISVMRVTPNNLGSPEFLESFNAPGPSGYILTIDPEQTYWPKILSRITPTGSMESAPLHLISPELPKDLADRVFRYV